MARRLSVTGLSLALAGTILGVASFASLRARDWTPFLYVSFGYYVTGWLFVEPSEAREAWLLGWDHRLLGDPTRRFAHWPGWVVGYLDVVYMCLFLPAAFSYSSLGARGRQSLRTMVRAADLGAFAPLSVFQTRPPWVLEAPAVLAGGAIRRLASHMVRNATIRVNTFPSGHAAVSFAIALAVMGSMPVTGVVLLVLAISVSVACVVGRYHYAIDVVAGVLLAVAVWAATIFFGI